MYALVVRFQVRPDRVDEFDALVAETRREISAHEPGTLEYAVYAVDDDPDARVFVEVYADEAAFLAHEQQPHTRRFLKDREPLLASVRVERLRPSG